MRYSDDSEVAPGTEGGAGEGRYLYGIADAGDGVSLGKIGIEECEVYTIPYRDICAVVHRCPAYPYESHDQEVLKAWVVAHQRVVDSAWERWGTILPSSFDTIIKGEKGEDAECNVQHWLVQKYSGIKGKIEDLRDKAEYGVQVFWDPKLVAREIMETNMEIIGLDNAIKAKSRGLAYMYRQKLQNLIKREMEIKADECFKDFYARIRKYVDDICVEKTKEGEQGLQMIMNLSCLVSRGSYIKLAKELDGINRTEGFSIRFTGPWPPYSFVRGV